MVDHEVVVTEVVDVVAAEVVVTNLPAVEDASNAARKATFHENAPTSHKVEVVVVTANATNVANKAISRVNVPRGAPTNVSDARKGDTLVGIAPRVEVTPASIVTKLVICPENVH